MPSNVSRINLASVQREIAKKTTRLKALRAKAVGAERKAIDAKLQFLGDLSKRAGCPKHWG